MLRQRLILRLLFAITLFYALYTTRSYYVFQRYLSTRAITFADLPPTYALALNTSVANHEEPPLDFPYNTTFPTTKIPRTIHYIWFSHLYPGREAVAHNQHSQQRCQMFNPDYTYTFWDSAAAQTFFITHYPWFLPTYESYRHPIQRVDALKYFVLLHHGGVYMDFDIACRRPLEPVLQFDAWFPEASPLGVNNDLMAARPGHPVLKAMAEGLVKSNRNWIFPWLTIFWSTGPMYASEILKVWYQQHGNVDAGQDNFFVLPRIFYSESHTFFGHRAGGSWHGNDVKVVLWVIDRPWMLVLAFGILTTIVVVVRRRRLRMLRGFKEGDKLDV